MTIVGFMGLVLSLLTAAWAIKGADNRKVKYFIGILVLHLAASLVYYYYSQVRQNDSFMYYSDLYGYYTGQMESGTKFIIWMVHSIKTNFGGTYLDYFLLWQTFGLFGLILLFRALQEVGTLLRTDIPDMAYMLLLLPGTHFWTSPLGKDAPVFFGCCAAVWAVMNIKRRWIAFGAGLALVAAIRPHIAMIALLSLLIAISIDRRSSVAVKAMLVVLGGVGAALLVQTLDSELNLDVTNANSVADWVEERQEIGERVAGGGDISTASYYVKLFSLLFRPFFIDAGGAFGLIASVQNLLTVMIYYYLYKHRTVLVELLKKSLIVRYCAIYYVAVLAALAMVFYNVGLGMRQKEMATPGLILLFGILYTVVTVRQRDAQPAATAARSRQLGHAAR